MQAIVQASDLRKRGENAPWKGVPPGAIPFPQCSLSGIREGFLGPGRGQPRCTRRWANTKMRKCKREVTGGGGGTHHTTMLAYFTPGSGFKHAPQERCSGMGVSVFYAPTYGSTVCWAADDGRRGADGGSGLPQDRGTPERI